MWVQIIEKGKEINTWKKVVLNYLPLEWVVGVHAPTIWGSSDTQMSSAWWGKWIFVWRCIGRFGWGQFGHGEHCVVVQIDFWWLYNKGRDIIILLISQKLRIVFNYLLQDHESLNHCTVEHPSWKNHTNCLQPHQRHHGVSKH